MVHLVLLGRQQHLEPALRRRLHARPHRHLLGEERFGQTFEVARQTRRPSSFRNAISSALVRGFASAAVNVWNSS